MLVWRGIASLFHLEVSEYERTHALYQEALARYEASPFATHDRNEFIVDCVVDAARLADVHSPAISLEIYTLIELLTHEEYFWDAPTFTWSEYQTLAERANMRDRYRACIRFYEHGEKQIIQWRSFVVYMAAALLKSLPEDALSKTSGDDDLPVFTVPLVTLFDDPVDVIHGVFFSFFTAEMLDSGLFSTTIERLTDNVYELSGVERHTQKPPTKKLLTPADCPQKSTTELAQTFFGGTALELFLMYPLPFPIPEDARFEHCHILGGTGHGKTQLLQLLIYQDLLKAAEDGRSVIVIDSQGDLIRTLSHLALFAPDTEGSLQDRFVLVDPNDVEFPMALNMFDCNKGRLDGYSLAEREKLLNGIISLYTYMFGALLGAELTDKQGVIFKYLARLMLVIPNATIHTMRELMEDAASFRKYLPQLDPTTRQFFETQFFSKSFAPTKQQIARRLWSVLSHTTLDRMFSQKESSLDLFDAMNSGKIILINTAKDLLKSDGSQVLGRFFISMIVQAAMERATIPADERTPCFVYVDEAHEYFDENVSDLLIQARKYKVSLTSAHQTLDQLSPSLRSTMMTNTSTKLIGGVSAKDAKAFSEEMRCKTEYLQGIRKHKDETEFACWIRNVTGKPVTLYVPLGAVERQPTLSGEEYTALIDANRDTYCVPLTEAYSVTETAVTETVEPEQAEKHTAYTPEPTPPKPSPDTPKRKRRTIPIEPAPMGQGGQKHIYMQTLIKRCAEERGWRTVIEKPTPDGKGRIDISLEKGEEKIACEVSVTTTVEHELGNVLKCLSAGYEQILVVAEEKKRVKALQDYISSQLEGGEVQKVSFLLPVEALSFLDEQTVEPEETTVRGYKVKVSRSTKTAGDAEERKKAIAKVIGRSLVKKKY